MDDLALQMIGIFCSKLSPPWPKYPERKEQDSQDHCNQLDPHHNGRRTEEEVQSLTCQGSLVDKLGWKDAIVNVWINKASAKIYGDLYF